MRAPATAVTVAMLLVAPATAHAAALSVQDASGDEAAGVVFTVTLDAPTSQVVQFDYSLADGTATGATDYSATSGSGKIEPGQSSTTVSVPAVLDKLIEPPEDFTLNLGATFNASVADGQGLGTLTNAPAPGKCVNVLKGTKTKDSLTGTDGSDVITGLDEADKLFGLLGNDCLDGGRGNDTVDGGAGDDALDGRGGKDKLFGAAGKDDLSGGGDNDTLAGGAGDDKINGGSGKNKVTGGAGNDNIATQNGRKDTVDCGPGSKDKIRADEGDSVKNCEIRVAPK